MTLILFSAKSLCLEREENLDYGLTGQSKSIICRQISGENTTSCPAWMCNSWAIKRIWNNTRLQSSSLRTSAHESLTPPANVSEFPDTSAFYSTSKEINSGKHDAGSSHFTKEKLKRKFVNWGKSHNASLTSQSTLDLTNPLHKNYCTQYSFKKLCIYQIG